MTRSDLTVTQQIMDSFFLTFEKTKAGLLINSATLSLSVRNWNRILTGSTCPTTSVTCS